MHELLERMKLTSQLRHIDWVSEQVLQPMQGLQIEFIETNEIGH